MAQFQLYHPFADATFNDILLNLCRPGREDRGARRSFPIDVAEDDKQFVVRAELPGVAKDAIEVAVEGNQVTIGAEVKRETESREGEQVLRTERYAGSLYRSFALPVELDEGASEARYDNGVLELKLAKKVPTAARRLSIQ